MSDQLVAETCTWQHTTLTRDRQSVLNHNPSKRMVADLRLDSAVTGIGCYNSAPPYTFVALTATTLPLLLRIGHLLALGRRKTWAASGRSKWQGRGVFCVASVSPLLLPLCKWLALSLPPENLTGQKLVNDLYQRFPNFPGSRRP